MDDPLQLTDEAIVARLAVGDTGDFPVLVTRYRRRVYALLFRATGRSQDADDLFQETWIRIARGAARFDPSRQFSSWVARIATNVAIDWMRAASSRAPVGAGVGADAAEDAISDVPTASESLVAEVERRRLAAALAKLPERMREAVLLRYFEGLSEHAMSSQLGIPHGTVKSRLSNAVTALRRALIEETPSDDA
ncbi:MAG: polymerase subunit sigma-70 [Myxococcales bacterium]|nr:polymerase subunit sigma-70 [Myxococcales bacterium]